MESQQKAEENDSGIVCDRCECSIPTSVLYYHCHYCNQGNYDLCGDCVDRGHVCNRPEHRLFPRRVENAEIVEEGGPQDLDTQSQSEAGDSEFGELAEDYLYTRLKVESSPSFRLIELLPGMYSETVECSIRECALDESSSYEALSYCWGELAEKVSICCNGSRLSVTPNLKRALKYLRHESEPRVLWVDAICINQEDNEERSHQVGLMPKIYQQARRTVVWLGESSADSDVAIGVCERIGSSVVSENSPVSQMPDVTYWNAHGPFEDGFEATDLVTKDEVAAVARLLKRPWFSRVWIIQEIGRAAEVIVKCGKREIDFDILIFGFFAGATLSEQLKKGRPEYLYKINLLHTVRNWREMHSQFFDLSALLQRTRRFQSSDPRDKIFALYGLTSTNLKLLSLRSDYNATIVETYTQVSLAILNNSKTLALLELPLGRTVLSSSLPSWVTDWSDSTMVGISMTERRRAEKSRGAMARDRARLLFGKLFRQNGVKISNEILSQISLSISDLCKTEDAEFLSNAHLYTFKTSRSSQINKPIKLVDGTLRLSGHVIDKIQCIGRVAVAPAADHEELNSIKTADAWCRFLSNVVEYMKAILDWEDIACDTQLERYPTGEDRLQVFWQTLCAGFFPGTFEQAKSDFETWYRKFKNPGIVASVRNFDLGSPDTLAAFVEALKNIQNDNMGMVHVFSSMSEPTLERRLARTEKGYVGLVPAETQVDDVVAILKGGQLPFIFRSRRGPWQMIGASYIHGIMKGEAFDEALCEEIRLI